MEKYPQLEGISIITTKTKTSVRLDDESLKCRDGFDTLHLHYLGALPSHSLQEFLRLLGPKENVDPEMSRFWIR